MLGILDRRRVPEQPFYGFQPRGWLRPLTPFHQHAQTRPVAETGCRGGGVHNLDQSFLDEIAIAAPLGAAAIIFFEVEDVRSGGAEQLGHL
jgi:hypothetical protein